MADWLTRGLLFDGQVALIAARTTQLVQEAHEVHGTWPVCSAALGRVLTAATMMAAGGIKEDEGSLTLMLRGNGPAGTALAVASADASVRGYLDNPHVDLPATPQGKLDVGGALGQEGTLDVVLQQSDDWPYSGRVQLVSGEVGDDVAAYYMQSQQQPSAVYVGVKLNKDCSVARAAGLLLTPLPDCESWVTPALEAYLQNVGAFANAVERGGTPMDALCAIFGEQDVKLLSTLQPKWACNCSRERMQRALIATGKTQLCELAEDPDGVELRCHFCNQTFHFAQSEVQDLLECLTTRG